ncbi:LLM class flavin-dependent oxidoreductase [Acuticoccus mangrovi]|uniref:LLM class flavin-dependent oxidoreductase n=1 Tax=Acuticoccus mangrovi TaxID=2796142 RepID=A0A934IN32_9HYPH|nr:LLM class flavin-dependent oxidoreductase [Acuticoccus mangrovi]
MKFGNFLFPESREPDQDAARITETLAEAKLSEALGMDALWLGEHHFDGGCAYVDPVTFAASLATATERVRIGFSVIQTSLHHPVRLAEQLSLIDIVSNGRLIVGLGRGTNINIYEYLGYGIAPEEAQPRYEEADAIINRLWTEERVQHEGDFWTIDVPVLRPRPMTRPHPFVIRAASGEASMQGLASRGLPFLMNVQSNATTADRIALYRDTMRKAGYSEEETQRNVGECWVWRNVFVAETDAEAEKIALPAFEAMREHRAAMRTRVYKERGLAMSHAGNEGAPPKVAPEDAIVYGSPATVAEKLSGVEATGVGGVIMTMRLGPMPHEVACSSMDLFMNKVAPALDRRAAA